MQLTNSSNGHLKHQPSARVLVATYLFLILWPECRHSVIVCGDETDVDEEDGVDEESERKEEEEQLPHPSLDLSWDIFIHTDL